MDQSVVAWINEEALKLNREDKVAGGPREKDILKNWRLHRPQMVRDLNQAGVLEKALFVLDHKRWEAQKQYIQAGWPPTDAEEQATKEWLLMEESNPNQNHHPLLSVQIST